jgi:hypothetical protein
MRYDIRKEFSNTITINNTTLLIIMNIQVAANILELNYTEISSFTPDKIKKQYYKLALQYHPDKHNNSAQSTAIFQDLNTAYHYLMQEVMDHSNASNSNNMNKTSPFSSFFTSSTENNQEQPAYISLLTIFVNLLVKSAGSELFSSIVKDIVLGCKQISIKLFDGLSKEMSLEVYSLLLKYQHILCIKEEIIEQVRSVLFEKYKNTFLFSLNPSLEDLFESNVYKLMHNGHAYFVPLWHSELYYDYISGPTPTSNGVNSLDDATSDGEVIVKCIPDLGENIFIDEMNNIHTTMHVFLRNISLKTPVLELKLGARSFEIPCDKLMIKPLQYYTIRKKGIAKIDDMNMYSIEQKADIVVKIILE